MPLIEYFEIIVFSFRNAQYAVEAPRASEDGRQSSRDCVCESDVAHMPVPQNWPVPRVADRESRVARSRVENACCWN